MATEVVPLVQVPPVDVLASVVTEPKQTVGVPVMDAGAAFTVTVTVA